ncbi:Ribonuclease [Emticicia aquatica]|uniref:Ribonuclease n=1 Tax=Emticicia aquatica TaxID=1681835 RepID=A0ABM9ANP5_9BACT|nr:MBL fold metallo-hydrolase [Emticicia aquatica]CAH0995456.1 Ribonuclease [Emticicia aquatica]
MKLTFWGATRQVSGSMFLLEFDDEYRVLIDCGTDLERENSQDTPKLEYGIFPFDPSLINLVILTHAHIDHSGQIPNLYKEGFEGQVLCTKATMELSEILLLDSASLNQRKFKAIHDSKKRSKKRKDVDSRELFLERQVKEALENFVPIPFDQKFKFKDDGFVTFIPAGHLLGAAHLYIEFSENNEKKTICFSGDVGRKNYPLLVDPQPVPQVDYLVTETTYGDRHHTSENKPEEILGEIIKRACIDIPGRLIIPSFSVGRTQAMLYTLNKLYTDKGFSPIKVFTDSPLAKASTRIYERNVRLLNKQAREFNEENDSLFDFENLVYLESNQASKAVSNHSEPCIIISASGMVTGGRIEHHIQANISNPYATILMVGYASENTLGWKLLNGERKDLTINGQKLPVNAAIEKVDVFSGHGDLDDLIDFVKTQNKEKTKKIFLVHGELHTMQNFKNTLADVGYNQVEIPEKGQVFEI